MAVWYYYDENGGKVGPMGGRELKRHVRAGTVMRKTRIENEEGISLLAGEADLPFPESWYYHSESGRKVGPMPMATLKTFVQQGAIQRETILENGAGDMIRAGDNRELFPEPWPSPPPVQRAIYETAPTPNRPNRPAPAERNPFLDDPPPKTIVHDAPPPMSYDPFVDEERKGCLGIIVEKITNFFKRLFITCLTASLILFAGGVAWEIFTRHQLIATTEKAIQEELNRQSWESTYISVTFPNLVHLFSNQVSTEYSATIRATEGFYEPVGIEAALSELGMTDNEKNFERAKQTMTGFPEPYRSDLYNAIPGGDLSDFQFYAARVAERSEKSITGSGDLARNGYWQIRWQSDIQVEPGEWLPRSQLKNPDRLDDDKTKEEVKRIILARQEFIDRVSEVEEGLKFDEALRAGVNEKLFGMPLETTPVISVRPAKTNGSVSGDFAIEVTATEDFFTFVSKEDVLKEVGGINHDDNARKLGIPDKDNMHNTYKEGVDEKVLNQQFYKRIFLNGDKISLSGSIELARRSSGDWEAANQIQLDSVSTARDENFTLDRIVSKSKLPDNNTIIDSAVKENIEKNIKKFDDHLAELKKLKDEFDKFCGPGMQYTGNFGAFGGQIDVTIDFTGAANPNRVMGTITFEPPLKKARVKRPFELVFNIQEKIVTGNINNANLLGPQAWQALVGPAPRQVQGVINLWNVMNQNTEIEIRFENARPFSIHGNGANRVPRKIEFNLQAVTPPGRVFPWDRNFLATAIEKYNPGKGPGTGGGGGGGGGQPGELDLLKEMQAAGFDNNMSNYLQYGTSALRGELERANRKHHDTNAIDVEAKDAAERAVGEVKVKIEDELKKIAGKEYFLDYTCSENNPGDAANHFTINTNSQQIQFTGIAPHKASLSR